MRGYEIMLILPADADEALVGTAVGRIEKVVVAHGGALGSIDRWGRRRFAFELDKRTEGYYVVVRFTAEAQAQAEIGRTLNLADEVIRHKVMLLPDERPDASDVAGQTASPAPAGSPA